MTTTAAVNPTGLDLVVGDNVRWTDGRTKQFEAGRVIGFDHGHVIVSHHGRTRRVRAVDARLSDDLRTRRRRAARAEA